LERAYAKQSPKFKPAAWAAFAEIGVALAGKSSLLFSNILNSSSGFLKKAV
jgi:hypothetical protein